MTDHPYSPNAVPSARGLYFGWRVVLALFLVTFAIFGVSIYSFIIFTQPLSRTFGWSAAQSGGLVSAMWLVAPLALASGAITTRFSPWRLIAFGLCLEALALVSLGLVSSFWQLYLLRLVMGLGKVITVCGLPLLVARWFSRRFATAMALVWAGGSAGGFVMAPLTESLVASMGWKPAALALAAGLIGVVGIVALLGRGPSSPADLGLSADGVPLYAPPGRAASPVAASPLKQDLRAINPLTAFLMFVAIMGAGMGAIAVLTQEPALLKGAGLAPALAATLLGLTAGGSLVGSVTIGWMLDRLHGVWSSAVVGVCAYLGVGALLLLPHMPGLFLSLVGALSLGYAFGAGEVLWITLTKRQFGEALFPTTYGGWYFALQAGYAAGGGLAGWSFDHLGPAGFLGFVSLVYLPPAVCSLLLRSARQPAPLGGSRGAVTAH